MRVPTVVLAMLVLLPAALPLAAAECVPHFCYSTYSAGSGCEEHAQNSAGGASTTPTPAGYVWFWILTDCGASSSLVAVHILAGPAHANAFWSGDDASCVLWVSAPFVGGFVPICPRGPAGVPPLLP